MTPLGFNEASTYYLSPSVTPGVAHRVKLCIHEEWSAMEEDVVFHRVETLEDYKQTDDITSLFDTWVDHDYIHIVVYHFADNSFTLLQNTVVIGEVGYEKWRSMLLDTLRSQREIYIAHALWTGHTH